MARVLRRGKIRLKYQTDTHRVASRLRHVDGCLERVLQLQLAPLDGITCRIGSSVTSTFGSWRFSMLRSKSQLAPSR